MLTPDSCTVTNMEDTFDHHRSSESYGMSNRPALTLKLAQSTSVLCAHEDGLEMPDQWPFKSKFLTRSAGP